jgi:hypothetical protein
MNPSRPRLLFRPLPVLALAAIGGLLAAARPAAAASPTVTFHLVADTATAIPGGTGSFTTFFSPADLAHPPSPCISFGTVAFFAAGPGQQGIYMFPPGPPQIPPGPPIRVADLSTAIPGGSGNFTAFSAQPSIGPVAGCPGGCTKTIAVLGFGESGQQGIYMFPPGPPERVADLSTAIPGGSGNFAAFAPPSAVIESPGCPGGCSKTVAAFGLGASGQQGIYMFPPGPPNRVADLDTAIPSGTGNFIAFFPSAAVGSSSAVVFLGYGEAGQQGIYMTPPGPRNSPQTPPGPPQRVVDTSTAMPGSFGASFATFGPPAFDGTFVAFAGASHFNTDGGLSGVYKAVPPGPPSRVADSNTPVPSGLGNFTGFGAVAVDPGVVVFEGLSRDAGGASVRGLYTDSGGVLTKIVATGDVLQGRALSELHFGSNGFSNGEVAFAATFDDGSQSITAAALNAPPPPAANCPRGQGFWKNHESAWPVASLTLGSQTYAQAQLLQVLGAPVRGDASLILARQLIASLLNLANGSAPGAVGPVVADAQARLGTFSGRLPYGVKTSSVSGTALTADASLLETYNSGALTGCAGDDDEGGD